MEAFQTLGIPFYLKVDIEGADHLVLDGLHRLKDRPRYISIEAEAVDFKRLVAQLDALRDLGYHGFKPLQQARMPRTQIATRPSAVTPSITSSETVRLVRLGMTFPGRG